LSVSIISFLQQGPNPSLKQTANGGHVFSLRPSL